MSLATTRDILSQRRAQAAERHARGASGLEVALQLAEAVEEVILQLYAEGLDRASPSDRRSIESDLALVAVGGFGRRELAPFSDVDVLLLLKSRAPKGVVAFAKRMVRDVWDVGLKLGSSVATAGEVISLARQEVITATALLEARLLAGSEPLFSDFEARFARFLRRGGTRLAQRAVAAIRAEQEKFGSTVHLLEPDVKRTAGGLRDLHLLRWLASAMVGTTEPSEWESLGLLGSGDARTLEDARDFLLRVRADLHFHAGRDSDTLTRSEQLRIAKSWGYRDTPSLMAVERFMRDYFRHTTAVADVLDRFVDRSARRNLGQVTRDALLSRRVADGVSVRSGRLAITEKARARIVGSLERTLEIAELCALHGVDLDQPTIEALRQKYLGNGHCEEAGARNGAPARSAPISEEAARRFLAILGRPGAQHRVLRLLHKVGLLSALVPEFEHARGLLQFNQYHKYTVDEHTFRMIQHAEELSDEDSRLGRVYRKIVRKDLLHLAILLHDLGKGYSEDHSEVGQRIAESAAERLGLSEPEREAVVFLVAQHLSLSQLAYHRDTSDPRLLAQFSREVGSEQMLRMLYVFTVVDTMAVGPDTYTDWKAQILEDVYARTLQLFGGDAEPGASRGEAARSELYRLCGHAEDDRKLIDELPEELLLSNSIEETAQIVERRRSLSIDRNVVVTAWPRPAGTLLITVLTSEKLTEGVFYKICGSLSAHRLEVLSARVNTLGDGTVIDQFEAIDRHHAGPPSEERVNRIGGTIGSVLSGKLDVTDALWNTRSSIFGLNKRLIARDATRVVVDNDSSDSCTVIDVFANNRRGLLYTLAKGINRLGLTIRYAKIATYEDEVIDVFYVQEIDGKKAHRDDRIEMIEAHLTADIHRLATDPRSLGL